MRLEEQKARQKFISGLAALAVIAACQGNQQKEKVYRTNGNVGTTIENDNGRETAADEAINAMPDESTVENIDANRVTNSAANEAKAHDFVEIEFAPGSALLTPLSRISLQALLQQASASGDIDKVLVMSWADEEYPSKSIKKLSRPQRDLAEKRNAVVRNYLQAARVGLNVDTYNMAKQPNVLARMFNTTDSRLKKSLVDAGLPTTADELQYPSKASHAVILVQVE